MEWKRPTGIKTVSRVAALAALSLFLTAADVEPKTFCQRLAPKMNMKTTEGSSRQAVREWKVNMLGGLGPALFGGSTVVSFAVRPFDEATGLEIRRLDGACERTKNGVLCKITGPARLEIGTKKGEVMTDVFAGERPVVEMRKTTIYCREEGDAHADKGHS